MVLEKEKFSLKLKSKDFKRYCTFIAYQISVYFWAFKELKIEKMKIHFQRFGKEIWLTNITGLLWGKMNLEEHSKLKYWKDKVKENFKTLTAKITKKIYDSLEKAGKKKKKKWWKLKSLSTIRMIGKM